MNSKVTSVDSEEILNIDQTPILFLYHSKRMLEKKGSKTINVQSLITDTKQVTTLPPMLIFKGAPNGSIVNPEFVMFPEGGHDACKKKVWMDEEMMNKWIDLILVL